MVWEGNPNPSRSNEVKRHNFFVQKVNDTSIPKKIFLCMGAMALGMIAIFCLCMSGNRTLGAGIQDLGQTQITALRNQMLADMMHDGLRAVALRSIVASQQGDTEVLAETKTELQEFSENYKGAFDSIVKLPLPPEIVRLAEQIRPKFDAYANESQKIVELSASGNHEGALGRLPPFQEVFSQLEEEMEAFGDQIQNGATSQAALHLETVKQVTWQGIVVFSLSLVFSGGLGWFIASTITKSLGLAVKALETNDMSALAGIESRDEIGRIASAVTNTLSKIQDDARLMQETAERTRELERVAAQEAAERQALAAEQERERAEIERERERELQARQRDQDAERAERERREAVKEAKLRDEAAERDRKEAAARQERVEDEARRQREQSNLERKQADEIQRKVDKILRVVEAASVGDLTGQVGVEGSDAIGQVGIGLQRFLNNLRNSVKEISEKSTVVGQWSTDMAGFGGNICDQASRTLTDASMVSAAAEQVSRGIQTVASAAEQMNASISEVTRSATSAASIATTAFSCAQRTSKTVQELGRSSSEIGAVVKAINAIAEQTNLLALNATIEAARAGEAGKGFAVVANEVKELSNETARATDDISQRVQAIQATTSDAVQAIAEITKVISEISELQISIAAALEEQSTTTRCISESVAEAAQGATNIAQSVCGVAEAADVTAASATSTKTAAGKLVSVAASLQSLVAQFKTKDKENQSHFPK
jgi:methyl-accepting chemotaxis protein